MLISYITLSATATIAHETDHGQVMSSSELLANHSEFKESYQDFTPSEKHIALLRQVNKPIKIIGLFGTWCHDSEREVPRIIKLIEQANNPNISLELIAVNTKKQAQSRFLLKYTPTFITFSGEQELGRIVERPADNLAADIVNML